MLEDDQFSCSHFPASGRAVVFAHVLERFPEEIEVIFPETVWRPAAQI
jgi:hypothetical protein